MYFVVECKDEFLIKARGTGKVLAITDFMEEFERINKLISENEYHDSCYEDCNDELSQKEREVEFIESLRKTAMKKKRRR